MIVQSRAFFDTKFHVPVPPCQDLWLYGFYLDKAEINLTRFLIRTLRAGDTFFDVGANVGFYSLLGATLVGTRGQIIAFEPCPTVVSLLRTNVATKPEVTVLQQALGAAEGTIQFFVAPGPYMVSSSTNWEHLVETGIAEQTQSVTVDCTTLDSFCFSNDLLPNVIKLDVEGTEPAVLKGGEKLLTLHEPMVVMEMSFGKSSGESEEALSILHHYGYLPFVIGETGGLEPMDGHTLAGHGRTVSEDPSYRHGLDNVVFRKLPDY